MLNKSKKILVLEDEKALAHAMELKLTNAGFSAVSLNDGEAGMEYVEKEKPDLILLDLIMPKMDGFKVLESLKEKKIKTPVIVMSNLSQPEDEKRAKELGAKDFLIKANTPIYEIVERVKKYF